MNSRLREKRSFANYLLIQRTHDLTIKRAEQFRDAIKNKKTLAKLMKDDLTGLPSKYALENLISNFNRDDYPPGTQIFCVYIDLKSIKAINDTLGESAGNDHIKESAKRLAKCFRLQNGQDILVRKNEEETEGLHRHHATGDEFVALLTCPQSDAEKLPQVINQRLLEVSQTNPTVSFRFGVSNSPLPQTGIDNETYFNNLINKANQNLIYKRQSETDLKAR